MSPLEESQGMDALRADALPQLQGAQLLDISGPDPEDTRTFICLWFDNGKMIRVWNLLPPEVGLAWEVT
jgi:hypothetical protein